MIHTMHETWSEKTTWMRTVGATDASWDDLGNLLAVRLGPTPVAISDDTTQKTPLAPRTEFARGAASRLVPRVDRDPSQ